MLRSVRARLLVSFLAPTLLFIAVAGALGYVFTRRILDDELGRGLSRIAASTAAQMNAERLLTIEPGDDVEESRTWRNFTRELEAIRGATGARRLFVVDQAGQVRVDVGGALRVGTSMPELERDRLELGRVREGHLAWSQVTFEGPDGLPYKTGYAPLRKDGAVVAIVGVEGTSAFFRPLRRVFQGYALLAAGAIALVGIIALLTARSLSTPLSRLMHAALRIRGGDLETPVAAEQTVEIGVLASELEAMRAALDSRDRQLKMMLAGVAHEVKNPIGGMELFAGLLREELTGEARGHVEKIQREIEYLKRIVDDFLAFAREKKLSLARVRAEQLLQTAHDLLVAEAGSRNVRLSVEAEPAEVSADESLLVAALANLVKNAVQASPGGGEVQIRGELQDGRYLVTVSDQGAGIDPQNLEKIFEPFFTTREQGTGLGLPLARKIVRAHGGELSLRSQPGETTALLSLPFPKGT